MRSGLWPGSSHSPDLITLKQRKRIRGSEASDAERKAVIRATIAAQPCHRLTVSRPLLVQSFKQECRPSETPAVLEFQHSLQKVLKEKKKKKKVPKPHWASESHRCRNAEVLHSLILIFTLTAVNLLISESLLLKWI